MGFMHGLREEGYDREYSDRELLRRIYRYFRPHARQVALVAAITVTTSLISVVPRIVMARGLDVLVRDRQNLVMLLGIIGVVLIGGIVDWGGNWMRGRMLARVTGSMMLTLRDDAFSASMRHDLSFFDRFRSGSIISRITSDTEEFAQVIQLVTDFLGQVLQVVLLMGYMASISWRLTVMMLAFVPVVLVVALSLRRLARKVTRQGFRVMAEVNTAIQEAVTGISVAKNYRQERAIYDEFEEINNKSYRVNLRRGYTLALSFPMLHALSGFGTAVIVYFGGIITATGAISVGSWYLFVSSMDRFWFPILSIAAFWNQFQGGLSAAERVFALIDAEAQVVQTDDQPVGQLRGDIEFAGVNFRYTEQEQVLKGFDLHIQSGESIALVGHTGAGKSSLANLMARFYEYQSGEILVDGRDIRTLDLTAYRRQLGIVSQMPFLFSGQRQLVALMRVLVQRPAIFILDEATASIDPFTEAQIQDATDLILSQSTSILIAHRLSTIRAVDRILVLREGEIIEEGSHDSLMARGGHYAELYNTYFRHQSPDYRPPVPEGEDDSYLELLPQYSARD